MRSMIRFMRQKISLDKRFKVCYNAPIRQVIDNDRRAILEDDIYNTKIP